MLIVLTDSFSRPAQSVNQFIKSLLPIGRGMSSDDENEDFFASTVLLFEGD